MKITFTGEHRYYGNHLGEVKKRFAYTLLNDSILRGNAVLAVEKKISEFSNRKYAVAVNSGTDALLIALKSLDIQKGDEVIVTAFSFVASASAILSAGAEPVFIDIDADTCLMDISRVENSITSKTKAIIAVNLFGQCIDYEKLNEIAKKNNIKIVEDAAQSFGSKFSNIQSGAFGDVSIFSFDYTKVLGGITTGGIILTNDFSIYRRASKLRQHGYNPKTKNFEMLGGNSQMSSINASIIDLNFEKEPFRSQKRNKIAGKYIKSLSKISEISLLRIDQNNYSNYHKFVIKTKKRNLLQKYLEYSGIETKVHYNRSLPEYSIFQNRADKLIKHTPIATATSKKILSLPIYPELKDCEINYICSVIKAFYNKPKQ